MADKLVRITREDDYEKRWIVVGTLGAIDFHYSHAHLEVTRRFGVAGGVEFHYRAAPEYMESDEPSHDQCWILGGRCWHDGTSLWASEYWIPLLQSGGEAAIWHALEYEYRKRDWPALVEAAK